MIRTNPGIMQNIDTALAYIIADRRNISKMDALKLFLESETHKMVLDDEMKVWHFAPLAIYDMWENEEATGDPRNSVYIRGDEIG